MTGDSRRAAAGLARLVPAAVVAAGMVTAALVLTACSSDPGPTDADGVDGGGEPDDSGGGGGPIFIDVPPITPPAPTPAHPACTTDVDCPLEVPYCRPPGFCHACRNDGDCAVWESCFAGACLPKLCGEGEARCVRDVHFACQDDGKGWVGVPCEEGACDPEGGCSACPIGAKYCVEDTLWVCDLDTGDYAELADCEGGTTCVLGGCVQCEEAGEPGCLGAKAAVCDTQGRLVPLPDGDCGAQGLQCINGACSSCSEDSQLCQDGRVVCLVDGELSVDQDCAALGLVCYEGRCQPACSDYDFKTGSFGNCPDGACCQAPDGTAITLGLGQCLAQQWELLPWSVCQEGACCRTGSGLGAVVEETSIGTCNAKGGEVLSDTECLSSVCCQVGDGLYTQVLAGVCGVAGQPVADWLCLPGGCCALGDGTFQVLDAGECLASGGTTTAAALCETPETQTVQADAALEPTESCDTTTRLAVPSSVTDEVVVFDLQTLEAVTATTVCDDPSRLVMDLDESLYGVCRGDGRAYKLDPNGSIAWNVQLDGCHAARGVAIHPTGRLFVGCSVPGGRLYELSKDDGAQLWSLEPPHGFVYGMAADIDFVYVGAEFNTITAYTLTAPVGMEPTWTIKKGFYGLAPDGLGHLWLSGHTLRAVDTATGLEVEAWDLGEYIHGVTVGQGGLVYAAVPMLQSVTVVQLGEGPVDNHVIPGGDPQFGAIPKGVALDAEGNVYSINLFANNVVRVAPNGAMQAFGDGDLTYPYAYNGDLTGLTGACITGTSSTWLSGPIDSGADQALWTSVAWTADVPDGAVVALSYRTQESAPFKPLVNGGFLGALGPTIQLRAVLAAPSGSEPPSLGALTLTYVPNPEDVDL